MKSNVNLDSDRAVAASEALHQRPKKMPPALPGINLPRASGLAVLSIHRNAVHPQCLAKGSSSLRPTFHSGEHLYQGQTAALTQYSYF